MNDIVVRIPAALQAFTAGQHELRTAPGTVAEVLHEVALQHPQLIHRLVDAQGDLRPFVNVFIGRANIRGLQGLATPIPAGEVLSILPAVAGG
jgi:molybdopterin converting factor small subunit